MPSFYRELTSDVSAGLRNLIDWLTGSVRGDLATPAAGPAGVTVVEASDGTVREVSSDGTLAGLGATNLWRTTGLNLPTSAWIVVEFPGTYGEPFQVMFAMRNNAERIACQLFPMADFVTGGAVGLPTVPATAIPAALDTAYTPTNLANNARWYAAADAGVFVAVYDDGVSADMQLFYVGEVDGHDEAADTRPFVICYDVDGGLTSATVWARLSHIDNTTELLSGVTRTLMPDNLSHSFDAGGRAPCASVSPSWTTGGHNHIPGTLRYLRTAPEALARIGTMSSHTRLVLNAWNPSSWALVLDWDGETDVP